MKPQAMIFDMDGTLFQTETLLLPAYHAAFNQMKEEGSFAGPTPPEERILGALGMLLEEIWRRVLPDETEEVRQRADELLLEQQTRLLAEGLGDLYPEVRETLEELHHRGIRLFVASNGLEGYIKEIVQHQRLQDWFEGLYSAGEFQTRSKVDLVRLLLDRYELRPDTAWMVGDRSSDVEAGRENGLYVVGCDYAGFGEAEELAGADVRIRRFSELLQLV